jgi:hypothetical protein
MTHPSLLSDDLVRALMAVGEVDVLVGVPTLNNASTVRGVVHAVSDAFVRYFPRQRTLLLNVDGGSTDGTPALIRHSKEDAPTVTLSHRLRTEHRISTPYHGLPGKGSALRQILTVAELTQAKAVAVVDAEVTTLTPEWIAALVRPVLNERYDYVAPFYARHPFDGPLVSQLVRPLVRAAYGWQLREPLAAEFGGSSKFLAHCLEQDVWESDLAHYGIDLWITGAALSGGFRCCQAPLGVRHAQASPERPGFPEVFEQVVGATFGVLERHAGYWVPRIGSEPLPVVGQILDGVEAPAVIDGTRLTQTFCADLRDLEQVLEPLLRPETLSGLIAAAGNCNPLRLSDELWTSTVYEFLVAHHRGVMRREHIARALVSLYLGRTGSFLTQYGSASPAVADAALEALCMQFERSKPAVVAEWHQASPR